MDRHQRQRDATRAVVMAGAALLWWAFAARPVWSQAPETVIRESGIPQSTVGMPVEVSDLVLPGPELEPKPITDETPVVIRIDAVYPHGTAFRYDLVVYTLEPGEFDLRDYLRRKDGSGTADLPAMSLVSESLLPPGQIEPHELTPGSLPWLGGYRTVLIVAGVIWLAGLIWIIYPRGKRGVSESEIAAEPTSLADRLRPLVVDAVEGRADPSQLAELERALVRYWRRRLGLEQISAGEALAKLREHPDAGALITQLEEWLHRPNADHAVDVNALLAPYRDVSPDDLRMNDAVDSLAPAVGGAA